MDANDNNHEEGNSNDHKIYESFRDWMANDATAPYKRTINEN